MLNIVIPMAGRGSRFEKAGYTFPKPLIDVGERPMIQVVVDNLRPKREHVFTFICQKEHYEKYHLKNLLNQIAHGCNIVQTDGVTEGAACTVLLASEFMDNDDELILANSDQYVDFSIDSFIEDARKVSSDGHILVFPSFHPKWSFAKLDDAGRVVEVAVR